jgi:hypothetical protein
LKSGLLEDVLSSSSVNVWILVILAGAMFTSVVTTAPAILFLGFLAIHHNFYLVVLIGALGALCGDLFLFRFVKDSIAEDLLWLFRHQKGIRFYHIFHTRAARFIWPLLGAMVIASPLPDEIGILIMGTTRMSTGKFMALSYVANAAGIALVGLAARSFI